ncbi:Glutamine transport ATP-binding protein GlnQ [Crateriforma conspicua]|uniref:Glutamine transport ATP-binding protein GlnQ n=1 Tax=Crateriforma conspicua TaxID=2527996 RepID=A0A5C6FK12_9PLAN|nr:ABC transporter permease [Crateriforma conspicua]TWU62430.1 Glutamine transport ATP-binding protein GlnQ [Crateriforma conspicua]
MTSVNDPQSNGDPTSADVRSAGGPVHLERLCVDVAGRRLLDDARLNLEPGKLLVVVGGSGAGKSVLLRILAGLLPRDGSVVRWSADIAADIAEHQDIDSGSKGPARLGAALSPLRRRVGVVFQQFALFDELSPTANVQFAMDHRGDRHRPPEQDAAGWLAELGVPAEVPVAGLSGGQKQRLAIARTLASDPEVILYDEPTSGLDAASGAKVASLIRQTQQIHHRTSVVVTHDYQTLIPIADEVVFLDNRRKQLVSVPRDQWSQIRQWMHPVAADPATATAPEQPAVKRGWSMGRRLIEQLDAFLLASSDALISALRLPVDVLPIFPRWKWAGRFFMHYLRLVGGPSACVYLAIAGLIAGFTTTYFTFRFLPFRLYTQPLLIDELLASIGFALYRILVPVLATILVAARCGAAVAADVGVKRYGGQVDAMRTLGVRPQAYLLVPILAAFLVATPVLEWIAFFAARLISMVTFTATHSDIPSYFWDQHFFRNLRGQDAIWPKGASWVFGKNAACGVGTAVISYYQGLRSKQSAADVSDAITATVLWTTLWVLVVHFAVALMEF